MTLFHTLFAGVIPAIVLALVGARLRSRAEEQQQIRQRWHYFLLGTLILLLAPLVAVSLIDLSTFWLVTMLVLPAACGTTAALLLHIFAGGFQPRPDRIALVLIAITLGLGVALGIVTGPGVLPYITIGGALLALFWHDWAWIGRRSLVTYPLILGLLLISVWSTDTHRVPIESPDWLAATVQLALFPASSIAIIAAARLLRPDQDHSGLSRWIRIFTSGALILLILLLSAYQIQLASIWDVATDGLSSIGYWQITSIAGIGAALILAWSVPGRRRVAAIVFAVMVPLMMTWAYNWGAYSPDGEWGQMPALMTEQRAEVINQALQRYHVRYGAFPAALAELTPGYLLYIPNPLIIPGQTWCYEGGSSYYRLGYVYRQWFSTPASVRIHAATGTPPEQHWGCEDEAARQYVPPGYGDR